jgi:adenosylmethionine-8-amino-7-oxononanoate aminotransferase
MGDIQGKDIQQAAFEQMPEQEPVPAQTYLLGRDLNRPLQKIVKGRGNYLYTPEGREIFDATGGAAVSCLGHGNSEVRAAMLAQMDDISYVNTMAYSSPVTDQLAAELILGTEHMMAKAFIVSSGSEATEAAMKLARQYFLELPDPQPARTQFISRLHSYHGNTLGALSLSGHLARRDIYKPILIDNIHHISPCNTYRQLLPTESLDDFVARKAAELDAKFEELGPETVIGFVAEPVVGAALGCVPSPPGYLPAMKAVCRKHGALFMLDEVMSGMGRCGTLHAWQSEIGDAVPDIQTIGKGLGGGYQPIAGVLVGKSVAHALTQGTGVFVHGQTYQAHPVACAAALAVQQILRREKLLDNARAQSSYLEACLKRDLAACKYVGDIRGKGLFWGIEFVTERTSKTAFDRKLGVAMRVKDVAERQACAITVYPGQGTVDGWQGDHVILAPAYNISRTDVDYIVKAVKAAIEEVSIYLDRELKGDNGEV